MNSQFGFKCEGRCHLTFYHKEVISASVHLGIDETETT